MQKLITLTILFWVGYSSALSAQCASGTLSGTVFEDLNYDGINNDGAPPIDNIKIYLFDQAGQVDSTISDAQGMYSFFGKTDGQTYRVEFHTNGTGFSTGPFGSDSKTTVQFAAPPNCTANQGFVTPSAYCQAAPLLVTPCFINGDPLAGGSAGDTTSIVGMDYNASGNTFGFNVDISKASETGSCWGVSFQKETQLLFTSAVLKRHSGFGPGGTGAIYVFDLSNPAASTKIATIDLDALGFDTGTDPRILEPLPSESIDPSFDIAAYSLVGKMSLGDMDISEDGKNLYITNLFDRKIYKIFIDNPFRQPTASDVTEIPLTNPGCGLDSDWRPWGLEVHRGSVYAGLVCTGESNQDSTQLRAFIQKLEPGATTFAPFYDFGLTFERGKIIANDNINHWYPWTDDYTLAFSNFSLNRPQPILSDLDFETDGSLILGFADRLSIQGGFQNYLPDTNQTGFISTYSGGDLIKICNINGALVLEGAPGCDNPMGIGTNQGPNGDEFFWDDRYENSIGKSGVNPFETHQETSLGGIYALYNSKEVVTTQYDPLNFNTGGIGTFNTTTGSLNNNYEIFPALPGYAGKSAGLGDIDANCTAAPLEKGNFVWRDYNENGIQDPEDTGLANVNVTLGQVINGTCTALQTVQTNSVGEYYFNDANVPGGLLPLTEYYIAVGQGQFNSTSLRLYDSLEITLSNIGTFANPNLNDSDGELILGASCLDNIPHTILTTGPGGSVDHTCDFGFILACDIEITAATTLNETCDGAANGSISVTATTSDPAGVEYNINNGAFGPTSTFSNLAPATYTVQARVIGNTSCLVDTMFTILSGTTLSFTAATKVNETCDGDANGSISVTATTSDPAGVEYNINNGAFGSTSTFSNLAPATYTVQARVIGNTSCLVDTMFTILPGLLVPPASNVTGFGICQNTSTPINQGLKATCDACPTGFSGSINWYTSATSSTSVGTGATFDPVAAGEVDATVSGTTTFWVECACGPCVSTRVSADFTVFPLPNPAILGDTLPCPDETITYTTAFNTGSTYVWTLSGGGTIVSTNANQITIQWDNIGTGGTFILSVTETDARGCVQTVAKSICLRQPTLICNSSVQVSLANNCKGTISFDAVLEGTYKTTDGFTIEITDMNGTVVSTNGILMGAGMYNFKVTEPCQGNSCWGVIKAEDKLPPVINCQPVSFPCTYTDTSAVIPDLTNLPPFAPIGGGIGNVIITDNCGIAAINYSDQFHPLDCDTLNGVLTGILVRTWTAADAAGNLATCTQEISFVRQNLTTITFPNDTIISCETGDISPAHTGIPTILGNPVWPTAGFCKSEVVYTDQIIPVCDGTTKYFRTWQAFDWCLPIQSGNPSQQANPLVHVQVITVMDNQGPSFVCPADLTVDATTDCVADLNLPDVIVTDACSRIAYASAKLDNGANIQGVLVTFPGNNLWAPDTLAQFGVLNNLSSGNHTVEYTIQDDCGNTTSCDFNLTVNDGAAPTAICDAHTQVALGGDGTQQIHALTFDDGSFDNCGDTYFKVRRMQANTCQNNDKFDDIAVFCCSDIGDTVQVIMRVYDLQPTNGRVGLNYLAGHFDECMVTVNVVDKIRPVVSCPPPVTVECNGFDNSLWAYGQATAADNCALDTLTSSANFAQFDTVCNVGVITRTFRASDVYGNTGSCTQKITVFRTGNYTIKFPDDAVFYNCDGNFTTEQPIITGVTCEQVGIGYTDEILSIVPDACSKILRKWKVEDACQYDPNLAHHFIFNPNDTIVGPTINTSAYQSHAFEYIQVIKILDNQKPIITNCQANPFIIDDMTDNDPLLWNASNYWDTRHQTHDLCEAPNGLFITAYDSCSGTNLSARYTLLLDLNGDGTMETSYVEGQIGAPALVKTTLANQVRFDIHPDFNLPHGTHKIKWVVYDGCGNEAVCEYTILVRDGKKPTIVCKNGLTAEIMQTGMIEIWQSDFIEYGTDNCTPAAQLEFAIQKSGVGNSFPTTNSLTFTCADLATQFVEIWVRDKAGNEDFCETYVIIQDNMGACNVATAQVAGALMTPDIEGLEEAEVRISGSNASIPVPSILTSAIGQYNFNAIPIGDDYIITPAKTDDWLNGVNTYDLLLIQKHLLGIKPLNTPFLLIAADANKSKSVTPSDIIALRRMILGMDDGLPNNTSWRFVDESYVFPNPANPFLADFPENLVFGDLQQNISSGDFVSVKIGDLDQSAKPNSVLTIDDRTATGQLVFDIQNDAFHAGEQVDIHFSTKDLAKIEGFQFTLLFDTETLDFESLETGNLDNMNSTNFGLQQVHNGKIVVSWHSTEVSPSATEAFALHFIAKKSANMENALSLSNELLKAEAYAKSDEYLDIALRFDGQQVITTGIELLQNKPNPFSESTIIGFYLPETGDAQLQVFDMTGRVLHQVNGNFVKGYNAIQINAQDLNSKGALFYRIESNFGTAERKMIRN